MARASSPNAPRRCSNSSPTEAGRPAPQPAHAMTAFERAVAEFKAAVAGTTAVRRFDDADVERVAGCARAMLDLIAA